MPLALASIASIPFRVCTSATCLYVNGPVSPKYEHVLGGLHNDTIVPPLVVQSDKLSLSDVSMQVLIWPNV